IHSGCASIGLIPELRQINARAGESSIPDTPDGPRFEIGGSDPQDPGVGNASRTKALRSGYEMPTTRMDTHQKALQINLDNSKYGTFAEIGAGQEVARWFFRVGGAAGTIAKSISAYDMTVSDAIYGACGRY